jgi:hypothetical protein
MPTIYAKTDRGLAEFETRAYRLHPRLRTVLILVDGRRSDLELVHMLHHAAEGIVMLLEGGFIEAVAQVESPFAAFDPYSEPLNLDETLPTPIAAPSWAEQGAHSGTHSGNHAGAHFGQASGRNGAGRVRGRFTSSGLSDDLQAGPNAGPSGGMRAAHDPGAASHPGLPSSPVHADVQALSISFEARRRELLRLFADHTGPAGRGLASRMERSLTPTELRALLPAAVLMVDEIQGRPAAEAFAERAEAF